MLETKEERGLTLIALVITIIVLLLLAGISIQMLAGDNSILKKAAEAKEETTIGAAEEKIQITLESIQLSIISKQNSDATYDGLNGLETELDTDIEELLSNDRYQEGDIDGEYCYSLNGGTLTLSYYNTKSGIEKGTISGSIQLGDTGLQNSFKTEIANTENLPDNALVTMFKNAQEAGCDGTNCTDSTHLHIGDYVDYTPNPTSGIATVTESAYIDGKTINIGRVSVTQSETGVEGTQLYTTDTTTRWRVLGLNKAGTQVLITSASSLVGKCFLSGSFSGTYPLSLSGAEAYGYCVKTLNKICSIYHNSSLASETRSITIEDINNALGVEVGTNSVYCMSAPDTNIDENGTLGITYTYKSGDYAPENYLISVYNDTNFTKKVSGDIVTGAANFTKADKTVTGTGYYYTYTSAGITTSSPLYSVLFAGTTSESNYANSYYLASPGTNTYSSYVYFRTWGTIRPATYVLGDGIPLSCQERFGTKRGGFALLCA